MNRPESVATSQSRVSWSERSGFICRLCRQDATHNEVLHVSFCPAHGLGAPLDILPWRPEAVGIR